MSETPATETAEPRRPDSGAAGPLWRKSWWIPLSMILLAVTAVLFARFASTDVIDHDLKNIISRATSAAALLVVTVWAILVSSWSSKVKFKILLGMLLITAVAVACFRLENFSGDMNFTVVPRWAPDRDELLDDLTPTASLAMPLPPESAATRSFRQFLGDQRDGAVTGVELATDWTKHPPRELWRQPIGAGWSGFAVVGQFAVTQEQRGDEELIVCYELATGKVAWVHSDPVRFTSVLGGDGPRATPTIDGDRVYVQGATGILNCLAMANGEKRWSHNIIKETGADQIAWGRSGSPLVTEELVIVSAGASGGKSLVAYDKLDGELVWSGGDGRASYASPMRSTFAGVPQVLIVNESWISGHRLADGRELWQHPWSGSSDGSANTSQPVDLGDGSFVITKGYGRGAERFEVRREGGGFVAESVWGPKGVLKTKMTNAVLRNGFLYGLSGGILECVEATTGERHWKRGRYGHGQVLVVGQVLLITAEDGRLLLVEATPGAHRELASMQALSDKTWNTPALAGRYLLVRNHVEAVCYELALRKSSTSDAETAATQPRPSAEAARLP